MKKKVLIIEDDLSIKNIVSYILEDAGFEVVSAATYSTADIYKHKADAILLDEWINKQDGSMLCHEIKEIHDLKHTPVIIFSTSYEIEKIAHNCKADGFVRKPFDVDDLIHEIKKCCGLYPSFKVTAK